MFGHGFLVVQSIVDVVADVQIEQAVAVVVEKRRRHAEVRLVVGAAFLRHVGERAVTVVVKHLIAVEIHQVEIEKPVVVDVADRHAQTVARSP